MPCLVHKACIRAYAHDLGILLPEFLIIFCKLFELGWAYEREICRVKRKDQPFAFFFRKIYLYGASGMIGFKLQFRYFFPYPNHVTTSKQAKSTNNAINARLGYKNIDVEISFMPDLYGGKNALILLSPYTHKSWEVGGARQDGQRYYLKCTTSPDGRHELFNGKDRFSIEGMDSRESDALAKTGKLTDGFSGRITVGDKEISPGDFNRMVPDGFASIIETDNYVKFSLSSLLSRPKAKAGNEANVLIVGHSLAAGAFGGRNNEWKGYFEGVLGRKVSLEIKVESGSTIGWAEQQVRATPGGQDLVILFTGVNDVDHISYKRAGVSPEAAAGKIVAKYEFVISAIKKKNPNATILLLTMPEYQTSEPYLSAANEQLVRLGMSGKHENLKIVPLHDAPFAIPLNKTTGGGKYLHPTDDYRKMVELLKKYFPDYLEGLQSAEKYGKEKQVKI